MKPPWRESVPHGRAGCSDPRAAAARGAPDARRLLQLALAGMWLLDGVLQYQSFMFSKAFSRDAWPGRPPATRGVIAAPITWDATFVAASCLLLLNAMFATVQLLLGIGIAWRPTLWLALAGSTAWAACVWRVGEGLGMVLTGQREPGQRRPGRGDHLRAAGGAAVACRPRDRPALFTAARAVGAPAARALWLVLWLSLAYFALLPGEPGAAGAARHDRRG